MLEDSKKPKVSGLKKEMIVKKPLCLISDLTAEYKLELHTTLVKSCENQVEELMRVPQKWLSRMSCTVSLAVSDADITLHTHHLVVDQTLYLATANWGSSMTKDVDEIVKQCHICRRIDPASVR